MQVIPLTRSKETLVDDEDYEWLSQWKWYAVKHRSKWYVSRWRRKTDSLGAREVRMHQLIMVQNWVDHIDQDGLNNQRENLRLCTDQQNKCNRGKSIRNTSGFKGVSWQKQKNKWQVHISMNNKSIYLGLFANKVEAAIAYNKAALKLHGEFAYQNTV